MDTLRKTFRLWWQKPRRIQDLEEERTVSFLELFYDLAYVVVIAELTHTLVGDLTFSGLLTFIGLFAMVWMAWINGSLYHEIHGNNDIRTRIFTFLQMFALAGMAIFAHNAIGDGYQGFALSYAAFLAIVTYLWWRTGIHDPSHKPMSNPYALGFLVTTGVFIVSAFVPLQTSIYLWVIAIFFSLILPIVLIRQQSNLDPEHVEQSQRIRPSLVERFGLLTIIVLGEVVFAVVSGGAGLYDVGPSLIATIILGLSVAVGMWWVYFDYLSRRSPIQEVNTRFAWLYLHLPLTMSIALTGAGVLVALEHLGGALPSLGQWILTGSVVVFLLCVVALIHLIEIRPENEYIHKKGGLVALISAIVILILGFLDLNPLGLLVLINLFLLAPILSALKLWVLRLSKDL